MHQETLSKSLALTLIPVCIAALMLHPETDGVALCRDNAHGCWVYHFFHANILHLAINLWTILGIAFIFKTNMEMWVYSYLAASLYPFIGITPIVGLSGIAFCLMGCICFQVKNKQYYFGMIALTLMLGMLVPGIAGMLHTWCFLFGLLHATICNKNV